LEWIGGSAELARRPANAAFAGADKQTHAINLSTCAPREITTA
jgi:hypothetical protein